MPKYLNKASYPIFYNGTVFVPNEPVETLDVIMSDAFIFGTVGETYNIAGGVNDVLLLRFNKEVAWTTITLTAGAAQTAADIVNDINVAYGSIVAEDEAGRLKITAPKTSNDFLAVWLGVTGSTANATLGLVGHDHNPSGLAVRQAFLNSTQLETYNITTANNTFIFKFNDEDWITTTLTVGAARTAQQIVDDIISAYRTATGKMDVIARAVELITGSGDVQVQLISPVVNNCKSSIYVATYRNTALAVLGFDSDDYYPLVNNSYPQLVQQEILPLFNPIISSTIITFPGAGWTTFYTNPTINVTKFTFTAAAAAVSIYIEDVHNIPPIIIAAGGTFTFEYKTPKINKFVIQAAGAGNLTILELNN